MIWQDERFRIEARIAGFQKGCEQYFVKTDWGDHHGVGNSHLLPQATAIVKSIVDLSTNYSATIPTEVIEAIQKFTKGNRTLFSGNGIPAVHGISSILPAFAAEISYIASNNNQIVKSRVFRSFTHLNRQIVTDAECKEKWRKAFVAGETACERMGAVHLLAAGIWAFKAHSEGERTDLVLSGTIDTKDVAKTDSALVLTEWKLVRDVAKSDEIFN